jgi:hypothetical protein
MKKKLLYLFLFLALLYPFAGQAQNVGINNDGTLPAASAMLDVKSTSKGMLVPRMTTVQRVAIPSPANGLMVFDITTNTFWFYKSNSWTQISTGITLPYDGTHTVNDGIFKVTNTNPGNAAYAIGGNATGRGTGIYGYADSSGSGIYGSSVYGAGVEGFSYNIGGRFSSDGAGAGVSGFSSDGPGGEFESSTGPAIKALGRVEVTGNVGLGTITPAQKLDIFKGRLRFSGDLSANDVQGIEFTNSTGSALNGFVGKYSDSMMGFYGYTGGGWKMIFNNTNGNMGLQGNANPRAPLSFTSSTGNKIALWGNADGGHYGLGIQASALQLYTDASNADIVMGYGSSTAFTENMRIKGNGNVGIGVAPTEKLQVAGNIKASGNADIGGTIKIAGGAPAAGKVLTATNSAGNAQWSAPALTATQNSGLYAQPDVLSFITNNANVDYKIPFSTSFIAGQYTFDDSGTFTNTTNTFEPNTTGTYYMDASVYILTTLPSAGSNDYTMTRVKMIAKDGNIVIDETPFEIGERGNAFSAHFKLSFIKKMGSGSHITYNLIIEQYTPSGLINTLPITFNLMNKSCHLSVYKLYQ